MGNLRLTNTRWGSFARVVVVTLRLVVTARDFEVNLATIHRRGGEYGQNIAHRWERSSDIWSNNRWFRLCVVFPRSIGFSMYGSSMYVYFIFRIPFNRLPRVNRAFRESAEEGFDTEKVRMNISAWGRDLSVPSKPKSCVNIILHPRLSREIGSAQYIDRRDTLTMACPDGGVAYRERRFFCRVPFDTT